jgi:Protein of unknown function (DUF2752)
VRDGRLAWRGLAVFVLVVCGGALWLGGAGSLQAAQRLEALSAGRPAPPAFACAFRTRTGFPCPGCGGTTAFEHAAHGRWAAAAAANPLGAFAGLAAWGLALAAALTATGAGVSWLRNAGLAVLVLLPPVFLVNMTLWWMSLPPGAWR